MIEFDHFRALFWPDPPGGGFGDGILDMENERMGDGGHEISNKSYSEAAGADFGTGACHLGEQCWTVKGGDP